MIKMQLIKTFKEWLYETSIKDTGTEGFDMKADSELEDNEQKDLYKKVNICPRCGELFPCDCQEKDSMDSITANRWTGIIKKK